MMEYYASFKMMLMKKNKKNKMMLMENVDDIWKWALYNKF